MLHEAVFNDDFKPNIVMKSRYFSNSVRVKVNSAHTVGDRHDTGIYHEYNRGVKLEQVPLFLHIGPILHRLQTQWDSKQADAHESKQREQFARVVNKMPH